MNIEELTTTQLKNNLKYLLEHSYLYVKWPESQSFMEEPWFKTEAILDTDAEIGSSYLIPTNRIL